MDLRTLLATEALTDALADQLANAYCQNVRKADYRDTYELVRQELGMAVTDAQTMLYGVPDCEREYQRDVPFDWGMGV